MPIKLNTTFTPRVIETIKGKGNLAHIKESNGTYSIIYIYSGSRANLQDYIIKDLDRKQAISLSLNLLDYLRYNLDDNEEDYLVLLKEKAKEWQ